MLNDVKWISFNKVDSRLPQDPRKDGIGSTRSANLYPNMSKKFQH